jgi:hypothetical protein
MMAESGYSRVETLRPEGRAVRTAFHLGEFTPLASVALLPFALGWMVATAAGADQPGELSKWVRFSGDSIAQPVPDVAPEVLPEATGQPNLRQAPISSIGTRIVPPSSNVPRRYAGQFFAKTRPNLAVVRPWTAAGYAWEPTGICHRGLYFEEPNLERHGYSFGLLPVVSAAHFYGTIPALPYLAASWRPTDCNYTLGQMRPGSPVLFQRDRWPLSSRGAVAETLVLTGLIFTIP